MVRSLKAVAGIAVLVLGLGSVVAYSQQGGTQGDARFPDKEKLLRLIAVFEEKQRTAEANHADLESTVKVERSLAGLYQDAGMYPQSVEEYRREIATLRNGPQDELAEAVASMAVLHIAMGDLRQSEKDDLEALRIRESIGDPTNIALAWSDLADVYLKQQRYKQALEYAQKAMPVLADNPKADAEDRIVAQQTLALALCGMKQCGQAIALMQDALEKQKKATGADSLMVGGSNYLLGYVYWHNGNMDQAADYMSRGTARMKADLGWGHTLYLNAMSQYAQFLRQRGEMDAAATAEREVRMANTVVDARTLSASQSAFAGAK